MKKAVSIFLTALLAIAFVYSIHDAQTATGVGYFFCLKAGSDQRIVFDIIVDAAYTIIAALLVIIPLIRYKYMNIGAACRFFVIFTALMQIVSPDYVIEIFRAEAYKSNPGFPSMLLTSVSDLIPSIIVLILASSLSYIKGMKRGSTSFIWIIPSLLLLALGMIVPGLYPVIMFMLKYLTTVLIFDILESAEIKSPLLYGFLFLRAVYMIVYITAV